MKCVRSSSTALSRPQAQASTKSESSAPAGALVFGTVRADCAVVDREVKGGLVDACGLSVIGVSPHRELRDNHRSELPQPRPSAKIPRNPMSIIRRRRTSPTSTMPTITGGNCNRRHQQALVFDQRREKSGLKRRSVNIDGLDRVIDDRTNGLGIVEPDHSVSAEQLGLRRCLRRKRADAFIERRGKRDTALRS